MPIFKPKDGPQPEFLLASHPMHPPQPIATFPAHSATMGFSFNSDPLFGPLDNVFIAEFGANTRLQPGGHPFHVWVIVFLGLT